MGKQLSVGDSVLCQETLAPTPSWPAFWTNSPDPGPSSGMLLQKSCYWYKIAAMPCPQSVGPGKEQILGCGQVGGVEQPKAELRLSLESNPLHAWAGG